MTVVETIDGRSARRERNRLAVVEAVLELMGEGYLDPSVEEITNSSGVSQRSVFRYFDGLDDLRRAVIQHHFEQVEPLLHIESSDEGTFETRAKRFVNARLKLYEAAPNPTRVAWALAPYAPLVAEDVQQFRNQLDEQIRSCFRPELSKLKSAESGDAVVLIGAVVSFDSWDQMVTVHNRSGALIRRAWLKGIASLLGV